MNTVPPRHEGRFLVLVSPNGEEGARAVRKSSRVWADPEADVGEFVARAWRKAYPGLPRPATEHLAWLLVEPQAGAAGAGEGMPVGHEIPVLEEEDMDVLSLYASTILRSHQHPYARLVLKPAHDRWEVPGISLQAAPPAKRASSLKQFPAGHLGRVASRWYAMKAYFAPPASIPPSHVSDCIPWLRADAMWNQILEYTSVAVILVSLVTFCVETMPAYRIDPDTGEERDDPLPVFFAIESVCIAWFTVEYIWRLLIAPDSWAYVKGAMAIVDLIAILPYYIGLMVGSGAASSLAVVRILRLARVLRLLKLSRHSPGLQNMVACFAQTWREALMFCFMVVIAVVLISSLVYYCEEPEYPETGFISIPDSFWYGTMTVTTVGYGDVYPTTVAGKVVASICMLFGIILLSIPASIFIAEYMRLHEIRKAMSAKWEVPPLAIAETELHTLQASTAMLKVGIVARQEGLLSCAGKQRFQKIYMHTVGPLPFTDECASLGEVQPVPVLARDADGPAAGGSIRRLPPMRSVSNL